LGLDYVSEVFVAMGILAEGEDLPGKDAPVKEA
jgi:hypothetical protein